MKGRSKSRSKGTQKRRGKLCKKLNIKGDIYSKGKPYFTIINEETGKPYPPTIFNDKYNPNVIIKRIVNKKEYDITKYISSLKYGNEFISPRVYGFFDCNPNYDPNEIEEFSEEAYMVMEKIDGIPLNKANSIEEGRRNITRYIDDIFNINNLLYDKGIVLHDLYPRNIIITPENKVKFIDFDQFNTERNEKQVSISKRISKEQLLHDLIEDFELRFDDSKYEIISKGGKLRKTKKLFRFEFV